MTKAVIVFSGFNPRAVIAFLRTLEECKVPYGIVAKSQEDTIFLTEYRKKVLAVRTVTALDSEDILRAIRRLQDKLKAEEYVITPSTEALNRFLLDQRKEFEKLHCVVPLVDKETYQLVSDKQAFERLCRKNGINSPKEYKELGGVTPPFVAKPLRYFASDGKTHPPQLLLDEAHVMHFKKYFNHADFYFQEYVDGRSFYLLYYFYKNGDVLKLSQENHIQQPEGKSIIGARVSKFHETAESTKYEELFRQIHFRGLVMVEVKQKKADFYMIEANPRLWGPSQLFVDAGINLFEAFLYDWEIIDRRPKSLKPTKQCRYFWFGGHSETLESGRRLTFHNYDSDKYATDFERWMEADVYNRKDTQMLFEAEAGVK